MGYDWDQGDMSGYERMNRAVEERYKGMVPVIREKGFHQAQHQYLQNRDLNSHLKPGAIFDPAQGKKSNLVLVADDEVDHYKKATDRDARQVLNRSKAMQELQETLSTRADPGASSTVMYVTFTEYMHISKDPQFKSLAQYMNQITCDAAGRPRDPSKWLRPLLKNEMGMIPMRTGRGGQIEHKIICINNNPGDQYVGDLKPVGVQLETARAPAPVVAAPPAAPRPSFKVV